MRRITSKAHFDSLLKNPPEQPETWRIDAADVQFPPPGPDMRQMNREEIQEMATYLEVKPDELHGPFHVPKELRCPNCNRATTFLDFIKTAVDAGLHEKTLVRDVLCGRAGRWITIVAKKGERELVCVECNHVRRIRRIYDCNYEGEHYRYG